MNKDKKNKTNKSDENDILPLLNTLGDYIHFIKLQTLPFEQLHPIQEWQAKDTPYGPAVIIRLKEGWAYLPARYSILHQQRIDQLNSMKTLGVKILGYEGKSLMLRFEPVNQ